MSNIEHREDVESSRRSSGKSIPPMFGGTSDEAPDEVGESRTQDLLFLSTSTFKDDHKIRGSRRSYRGLYCAQTV